MYRFGALLLAASLLCGCSKPTASVTEPEPTAKKVAPSDSAATAKPAETKPAETKPAETTPAETKPAEPATAEAKTPESEFKALMKEVKTAQSEFMNKVRSAPQDEQMALFMSGGANREYAPKFLEFANVNPGTDSQFDAIKFAAVNGDNETASTAFESLVEKFGDDEKIIGLLESFERSANLPAPFHETFLISLKDKSSNDSVKGAATYMLVKLYQGINSMKEMADDPEMAKNLPQDRIDFWMKDRGDGFDAELEDMLASVVANYPDVELGRKGKLGKLAEGELFVFKYLSVGKVAPDIDGQDLDGKEFKLSDYRGKVVMLDFWGDW